MDAVYILGKGSLADDEELRFSIRSLCKNMLDLRNIYVVGELPKFLRNVHHIPCEDRHEKRWKNAFEKTRLASTTDGITDEFLLMNDDFIMLSEFEGAEFPFYAVKNGAGGCNGKTDFQIHCPIRYKKEWYQFLPLSLDMKGDFSPRSFYCNFYGAPPTFIQDKIMTHGDGVPDFNTQIQGLDFISLNNSIMLDTSFNQWLHELLPERCRFEH